ncbi:MAG: hypothetical protein ACRC28_09365, partial [Clostridium sp.]|uniref:hypothetical protein n=1 Tax=Clostridium sp. TaxID=1506 RepID=UPI003F40484E
MAVSLLYQKIIQGGFLYFGNALGLTKGVGAIVPGTIATQGAFMTVDTTTVAPGGWPAGTTLNWMDANSRVYVDIPNGTTIDEAFLIWGGNTGGTIGAIARTTPVYLITPDNVKHIVTPVTTLNGSGFYSCSANVTSIVSGFGSGNYICGSIPANITAAATQAEGGGWVLALAVKSQSGPYNYATLSISNDNYGQVGTNISIVTPSTGTVTANLMTAVIHAACNAGDALILQATRPFSAPNREAPNFFNSIISNNSGDGLPYTNATFGNNNNDPSTRSNILNGRQGLDLAIYPSSGDIPPNTNSYYLDGYNGGIAFSPVDGNTNYIAYGAAVNPSNAITTLNKTVDKYLANYGDTVIYTMNVVLEGSGSIFNFKIYDTIPDNTSFVPGSIFVNGVNKPLDNLSMGITLATSANLPYSATVTYSAIINSSGSFNNIQNSCYVVFRNTISDGTVFTNTIVSEYAVTTIIKTANINVNKSVNKNYTKIGDILTYTIVLNNSGILNATTATFIDTLPTDITLIPNTLKVDGVLNNQTSNP